MAKVFISHSTQDREFVEREIIPLLRGAGIETWYSRDNIGATEQWERSILQALKACDFFLLVMSPRSAQSTWVKREIDWVFNKGGKRIVPVLLEDTDPDDFHIGLAGIQHVDFREHRDVFQRKLLRVWGKETRVVQWFRLPDGREISGIPVDSDSEQTRDEEEADEIRQSQPEEERPQAEEQERDVVERRWKKAEEQRRLQIEKEAEQRQTEEKRRREEHLRQQQELAPLQATNLSRLKEDGRLGAWVESRLCGWDRADWLALVDELTQSAFWPLHPDDVGMFLQELRRDKTRAYLADADRPGQRRQTDPAGAMPKLSIPARGVWYSRPGGQESNEWRYGRLLPAVVPIEPGHEYLFRAVPGAADADLARLAALLPLPELKAVQLAECETTDAGLRHVKRLTQLRSFEVMVGHSVTDAGLVQLRDLSELRSLTLHRCYDLADSGLALLPSLRNLEVLTLWGGRRITDAGLRFLASLDNLVSLALWGCPLTRIFHGAAEKVVSR